MGNSERLLGAAGHPHWHVDIAHINIHGTFYYLCAVLDGASRYIVDWSLRGSMREPDVEVLLQRAREKFPDARPRIISDNGPQFIAKDFKEFIRISGMTHVRTSPYYPQRNGKLERWNKSIKSECLRPGVPLSLANAEQLIEQYMKICNEQRLHSAISYITPTDMLAGRRWRTHQYDEHSAAASRSPSANRMIDPHLLKIPARQRGISPSATPPCLIFTLNQDTVNQPDANFLFALAAPRDVVGRLHPHEGICLHSECLLGAQRHVARQVSLTGRGVPSAMSTAGSSSASC